MATSEIDESVVVPNLTDVLPISTEATTSRTVVNNGATRVVAFSMDAGQELTDHSTPRPVVVIVTEGTVGFTVAGTTQELAEGDVVYLAPGERHAVMARTPCRFQLVMVTASV
jgi:quercetin dioxygenase-like cupin family protein